MPDKYFNGFFDKIQHTRLTEKKKARAEILFFFIRRANIRFISLD